ncbi:MAG: hypothetical protein NTX15_00190, partial [Candidatus Kapabacteria bacterium]|nr:hypothetical protein [Candidatus Kapabacteria bacterium]
SEPPVNMLCDVTTKSVVPTWIQSPESGKVEMLKGFVTMTGDSMGRLWAATSYGVALRERGDSVFRVIHAIRSVSTQMPVISFVSDDGNWAWLIDTQRHKLFRVSLAQKGELTEVPLPGSFVYEYDVIATTLSSHRLFLLTPNGLACVVTAASGGDCTARVQELTLAPGANFLITSWNGVFSCIADKKERVWFSAVGGVMCFDLQTNALRYVSIPIPSASGNDGYIINPVHVDDQDRITGSDPSIGVVIADPNRPSAQHIKGWADRLDGVVGIDEDRSIFYSVANSTSPAFIVKSCVVNTRTSDREPLLNSGLRGVPKFRSRDGRMWITGVNNVTSIDPGDGHVRNYGISTGQQNSEYYSAIVQRFGQSPDGRVWAFTDYGKYVLDPASDQFVFQAPVGKFRDYIIQDAIIDFIQSRDGKTWVYGYREIGTMSPDGSVSPVALRPVNAQTELLASIKYVSVIDSGRAVIVDRRGVSIVNLSKQTFERIRSPFVEIGRQPYIGAQRDHLGRVWIVASSHVRSFPRLEMS